MSFLRARACGSAPASVNVRRRGHTMTAIESTGAHERLCAGGIARDVRRSCERGVLVRSLNEE